ncbi:MAG: class I SAM-dependent methyltransferase, partial [Campylobacter sp.]|nr:class I SAM-dependent methyltransferase [Campylobacter sp.]
MENAWDKKSPTYPKFSKDKDYKFERDVLEFIRQNGINFSGKTVLDIGCGTGIWTVLISKEAKDITGLDSSEKMLEILDETVKNLDITNIKTKLSKFSEFSDKFDISTCFMSPA